MTAFLLDLDNSFSDLGKSVKTFQGGLKDLNNSFDKAAKSSDEAAKGIKASGKALERFVASGKLLGGVAFGFLAIVDAGAKLKAIVDVGQAGYDAWIKFSGVQESLDFSEAITGSTQLADNFKMLDAVADSTFNKIKIASRALFNSDEFNKWSSSAVSAYAQVEEAAYKLATITTNANERSIDKLQESIKVTRALQTATNDALGSVELLNTQYDIASAGFVSGKDNLNVGKASVNLAQAGFGDVAGSTNAIVRALRALGDTSADAEKRAAQLFETTRVGLLTLNQLTPEVGGLAVASKNLGLEFSEVSAALAGLTTQGISSSEGGTRLQAFFSEVVAGSQQANQFLSAFRDEAGKPIQLNATALKEKGIGGIIADLKKATGGSQAALQQIFGRQESIEAVQLLSNLGPETLKDYENRIEGASGERLDEEAKNRQKTVSGAFQQAANSSQKQVENFGQGLAPSVIDKLATTNEVIGTLMTTSAEGIGKLAGSLSGLATKIKAIGGFIATAFVSVAPFAFFALALKGFQHLGKQFKKLQKEGEAPWDTIKRLSNDFIANTEKRLIKLTLRIRDEISRVKEEIKKGIDETNEPEQLNLLGKGQPVKELKKTQDRLVSEDVPQDSIRQVVDDNSLQLDLFAPTEAFEKAAEKTESIMDKTKDSVDRSSMRLRDRLADGGRKVTDSLNKASAKVKDNLKEGADKVKSALSSEGLSDFKKSFSNIGDSFKASISSISDRLFKSKGGQGAGGTKRGFSISGLGDSLKSQLPDAGGALQGIGNVGKKAGGLLKGGLKAAGPLLGSFGKYLVGMGALGAAAGAGIAVVSGWTSTFANSMNKKAIPAIQEMRESLLDLQNVEGLDSLLRSLDPIAGSSEGASYGMNVLNETVYRGTKLWNDLTGASANYFNNVLPSLNDAQSKIRNSLDKNLADAKSGVFGAETEKGKVAEAKINQGVNLTQDDLKALEDESTARKAQVDAEIGLQRQKIKEGEGKLSVKQLDIEKQKLRELEAQSKETKKQLDLQFKQIALNEAVKRFKTIDTSVPLQLQISDQNEQAINLQIEGIADKFKKGFEGTLGDAASFDKLGTEVSNALGSIETQVNIDPSSAANLRDDLRKAIPDFDKLIYSNPQLREKASALNKNITDSLIKQTQTEESTDSASLNQAQSLGSQSTLVAQAKYETQTKSINTQIKTLNDELSKPETTLARQKEILSQIEQLEAQRVQLTADNRIAQELGVRKQTLSFSEQLLDVEKARLNLFNQESRFGSLAVTAAEAKLQAAKQELAVKKEQLSVGNKEEIIKKEEIVKGLESKANRDKALLGPNEFSINSASSSKKEERTAQASKEAKLAQEEIDRKINKLKSTPISFDKNEIAQLKKAGAGKIVDDQGNFTGESVEKAVTAINSYADKLQSEGRYTEAMRTRDAGVLISNKDADRRIDIAELERSKKSTTESIYNQAEADNERTDRLSGKQISQNKGLLDKEANFRSLVGGSGDTTSQADITDSPASKGTGTTATDDLEFTKLTAEIKEQFGSLGEKIAVSEAEITREFASREKLIKRGELLGETLGQIAQNSNIFGTSIAGASLGLAALQITNTKGRLDKEADEEIAKINSKVSTLAENAVTAEALANKARAAGAKPELQAKLDAQASQAKGLADKAQKEAGGDVEFVKQKTALDKVSASLQESEAKINLEFKARENLAERTNTLADSFGALAGTALLSNSLAGASLQLLQAESKASTDSINTEANKKIEQLNTRLTTLSELATQDNSAGKAAREQLPEAVKEANTEAASIKLNAALANTATAMDINAARIKQEFSIRGRLIELSDGLGSALSTLASTAGSLFQNSSLGATLGRFAAEISTGSRKAKKEFDEQSKMLEARNKALREAVTTAEQSGADQASIDKLKQAVNTDTKQKAVEQSYLRQKLVLDTLNERLSVMSAEVNEVTDAMSKQAGLSKDRLDFEQRQKDLTSETNRSGRGLQTSLIGAFAKNNPFAELLQKKADFAQAGDDADLQKAKNVNEAKKETIDLTLQKQQLMLEQQNYENALTQTQLLSDMVSLQQGGEASFSNSEDVRSRLNQLPGLIENSRQLAEQRLGFVQQKLDFIPKELEQRNANVDRDTYSKQLGIVSQNGILDPSMLPEIKKVISGSTQSLSQFKPEKIETGSLTDADYQADLARINGLNASGKAAMQQQAASVGNQIAQNKANAPQSANIQAPINLVMNITGSDVPNFNRNLEQNMKQFVSKQVQDAMGQLSKQILTASKRL